MMLLHEFIVKLFYFFLIASTFSLVEILFLAVTEDIPVNRRMLNILNYFSLSYGIVFPVFCGVLMFPYYPLGTSRFKDFSWSFEIEHLSSKLFSYLFLMVIFIVILETVVWHYSFLTPKNILYLGWFCQVLLSFLVIQLIPLYPTMMGMAIMHEIKYLLFRYNKASYLSILPFLVEFGSFSFLYVILCLHTQQFHMDIEKTISWFVHYVHSSLFFSSLLSIVIIMLAIFYVKKRQYTRYVKYIRALLKSSLVKDPS